MAIIRQCEEHGCIYEHVCPHCEPEKAEQLEKEEFLFKLFQVVLVISGVIGFSLAKYFGVI